MKIPGAILDMHGREMYRVVAYQGCPFDWSGYFTAPARGVFATDVDYWFRSLGGRESKIRPTTVEAFGPNAKLIRFHAFGSLGE